MSEEKKEVGAKREGAGEETGVCPQIPPQIPPEQTCSDRTSGGPRDRDHSQEREVSEEKKEVGAEREGAVEENVSPNVPPLPESSFVDQRICM